MLSISKPFKGASRADYYLNLAREDYYLGGKEPPGFWLGAAKAHFGLQDKVTGDDFRNLLSGFGPDGESRLVHNAGSIRRRSGWDLTWSVPKSVSVAWSQAGTETRLLIEAEVRSSVRRAIAYLEEIGTICRRGADGVVHERARVLFAAFEHSTSRAQDPQLHVHTILLNIGVRSNGSTGTLDPRVLYRHQLAAGALFRAELAARLERALGLRARREGRCFELIGVPATIIEEFSKRRAQIEARLRELGVFTAAAAEKVALDTRPEKQARSREELFPAWQETGRGLHWSSKELGWLLKASFPARNPKVDLAQALDAALQALTSRDSHFSTRQLVQALAQESQGRGLDADSVMKMQAQLTASPRLVSLQSLGEERHWTTAEMLALEKRVLHQAEAMHRSECQIVDAETAISEVIGRNAHLTDEQREALRHVASAERGLRVVSGMAGTGKSTLFSAAREIWGMQGRNVLGACLAGKAATELAAATQMPAKTIQRVISELDSGALEMDSSSVLLVDEAGMVGTRQMQSIVAHCLGAKSTLVLCGDARQLQSIEAGGVFCELSKRYGAASLKEIKRQYEPWARAAVKAFAEGRTREALQEFAGRGLVLLHDSSEGAMGQLIADWKRDALEKPASCLILAISNSDVTTLNLQAQAERRQAGKLHGAGVGIGPVTVYCGDRIVFGRNNFGLGVCNGQMATVAEAANDRIVARLDSGRQVLFAPEAYPHVQLAYALTTCKAQGITVDRAFVYVDETVETREAAYVQASRARGLCSFYAVGDTIEDLVPSMNRSRPKILANSLLPEKLDGPHLMLELAC